MKSIIKILSLITVLLLILMACGCKDKANVGTTLKADYVKGEKCNKGEVLTFSDNKLTLSLDGKTCNITITEKESGNVWASNPAADFQDEFAVGVNKTNLFSQIAVSVVTTQNAIKDTNSYVSSVKKGTYEIFKIDNGFRVEYSFSEKFMIPVEYVIKDGSFEASILYSGIKEEGPDQISTISLLPYFGTAGLNDNGFLLVPDGSGAVINFNNGKRGATTYSGKVYGIDESLPNDIVTTRNEQIYIPLIGMKKNNGAYIARATAGAAESTVNASVSGVVSSFNNIYFKATYREAQNLSVLNGSLGTAGLVMYSSEETTDIPRFTVKYSFVESEEHTLGDMISLAREQLIDEGVISKNGDKASLYVDIYGGVSKQKSFVGIQYKGIEPLTTFKEAQQLIGALKDGGADALTLGYKNYSKAYFDGKLLNDLTPVGALGGKKGIKSLKEFADKNNTKLYFEADFYSFSKSGNGFSKFFDITKSLDLGASSVYPQKYNTNVPDASATPYYMLKPSIFTKAADSILKTAKKAKIKGIYLTNAASSVSADYGLGGVKRSSATAEAARAAEMMFQNGLIMQSPNDYMWKYMQSAVNIPVASSKHHLFDYDVPMLQMLLKGSVAYSGYPLNLSNTSDDSYLLHLAYSQNLHYGFMAADSSHLQSTALEGLYGLSDSKISEAAKRAESANKLYALTENLYITDFIKENGVSKTVYSDGTIVAVNYNDTEYSVDDISVSARGWSAYKNGEILIGGEE